MKPHRIGFGEVFWASLLGLAACQHERTHQESGRSSSLTTVAAGLPCWRSSGMLYCEVEVVEAKGGVFVGFAGASFHEEYVGKEGASWGIYSTGHLVHRQAPVCRPAPLYGYPL